MPDETPQPEQRGADEEGLPPPPAEPAAANSVTSEEPASAELANPLPPEASAVAAEDVTAAPIAVPPLTLREKHPVATRWMHWLNFPLLGVMIWSGLMIYWADSDAAGTHSHAVYRIGIGSWTLARFFPDWFYDKLGLTFSLAKGLSWHFFFMWLFGINGLLYVLYNFLSGAWRDLLPGRHALRDAWHVLLHDLHLRRELPSQGKYNAAQQVAYSLIVLAGAGSLVSGLAIYKPTQLHWLTWLLGGYEFARLLHFWLMMSYVIFFVIHVTQVAIAGWNNFRSMVAGFEVVKLIEKKEQP